MASALKKSPNQKKKIIQSNKGTPGANAVANGAAYQARIAAYVHKQFGPHGIEVHSGKTWGKNGAGGRRFHDLVLHQESTNKALGVECKYQHVPGSVEYKIGFIIWDEIRQNPLLPSIVVYGGPGFSNTFRTWLAQQPETAECLPTMSLGRTATTRELDQALVTYFDLPLKQWLGNNS